MTKATTILMLCATLTLTACDRRAEAPSAVSTSKPAAQPMTNRIDIPGPVRENLGMTFARVEQRQVDRTLRIPGRFELQPTARREARAPLAGRIELLVEQYQAVKPGDAIYRLDAPGWRELNDRISAARARVASMAPLREAHKAHEKTLADRVRLWQDRLKHLDALREAGGGNAAQFMEARTALNATEVELADTMEKDAQLSAEQTEVEATLSSLVERREGLVRASGTAGNPLSHHGLVVYASTEGVVETLAVTQGGMVEEGALVLSLVQPERVRFRAHALQSDLGRLGEDLSARIVAPTGGVARVSETITGRIRIGLTASADDRTVEVLLVPDGEPLPVWARAGVSASMEITLAGGSSELAVPMAALVRDGAAPIIFRRDPSNPDKAIRLEADIGVNDGRWVVVKSGLREGDEVVLSGNYQLLLATSGTISKGGHFHPDGTFHEGEH